MLNINLIQAIKFGSSYLVYYFKNKQHVETKEELNTPCDPTTGDCALHIAVAHYSALANQKPYPLDEVTNVLEIIKALRHHGADPTVANKSGETALSLSADHKLLLDIFTKCIGGDTIQNAVIRIVATQKTKMMEGYFEDDSYNTVPAGTLHFLLAAKNPKIELLELILTKAQNINILTTRNGVGETPIQVAYKRQLLPHVTKIVEVIKGKIEESKTIGTGISYDKIISEDTFGVDAAYIAAYCNGQSEYAEKLKVRENVQELDETLANIILAVEKNDISLLEESVLKIAEPVRKVVLNAKQKSTPTTLLNQAITRDNAEMARTLIAKGARLGSPDDIYENTALFLVLSKQSWNMLENIILASSPRWAHEKRWYIQTLLNIVDLRTSMSETERQKTDRVLQLLLSDKKLDLFTIVQDEPMQMAYELILEKAEKAKDIFVLAHLLLVELKNNKITIFQEMPKIFPNHFKKQEWINNAHQTLKELNIQLVNKWLNFLGEDANKLLNTPCMRKGGTLLHWAANHHNEFNPNHISTLIAKGADISIKDESGCLPIDRADSTMARCLLAEAVTIETDITVKNVTLLRLAEWAKYLYDPKTHKNITEIKRGKIKVSKEKLYEIIKNLRSSGVSMMVLYDPQQPEDLSKFIAVMTLFLEHTDNGNDDVEIIRQLLTIPLPITNEDESLRFLQDSLCVSTLQELIGYAFNLWIRAQTIDDVNAVNSYSEFIELVTTPEVRNKLSTFLNDSTPEKSNIRQIYQSRFKKYLVFCLLAQQYNLAARLIDSGVVLPTAEENENKRMLSHQDSSTYYRVLLEEQWLDYSSFLIDVFRECKNTYTQEIIVCHLGSLGVNLKVEDKHNHKTLAYYAVETNNLKIVGFLLVAGENLREKHREDMLSPLELAIQLNQQDMIDLIEMMCPAQPETTGSHPANSQYFTEVAEKTKIMWASFWKPEEEEGLELQEVVSSSLPDNSP